MLARAVLRQRHRVSGRGAVLAALVAAAVLLGVMAFGLTHQEDSGAALGVNAVGGAAAVSPRAAPDISLTTFAGEPFRSSEQAGKLLVVNFWASWCPPCRDEAMALEQTWRSWRERGVVFVGIDLWDRPPAARQFVQQFAITYPTAADSSGETAIAYGVRGLPETFFIDRSGRLVRKWIGPLTERQLAATLDDLHR